MNFLPQPSGCWNYRSGPPRLAGIIQAFFPDHLCFTLCTVSHCLKNVMQHTVCDVLCSLLGMNVVKCEKHDGIVEVLILRLAGMSLRLTVPTSRSKIDANVLGWVFLPFPIPICNLFLLVFWVLSIFLFKFICTFTPCPVRLSAAFPSTGCTAL